MFLADFDKKDEKYTINMKPQPQVSTGNRLLINTVGAAPHSIAPLYMARNLPATTQAKVVSNSLLSGLGGRELVSARNTLAKTEKDPKKRRTKNLTGVGTLGGAVIGGGLATRNLYRNNELKKLFAQLKLNNLDGKTRNLFKGLIVAGGITSGAGIGTLAGYGTSKIYNKMKKEKKNNANFNMFKIPAKTGKFIDTPEDKRSRKRTTRRILTGLTLGTGIVGLGLAGEALLRKKNIKSQFLKDFDSKYGLLGINPNATKDEVKKAYKKQSIKYHPNSNPTSNTDINIEKWRKINEQYKNWKPTTDELEPKYKLENKVIKNAGLSGIGLTGLGGYGAYKEYKNNKDKNKLK